MSVTKQMGKKIFTGQLGLEPRTPRLTVERTTIVLLANLDIIIP